MPKGKGYGDSKDGAVGRLGDTKAPPPPPPKHDGSCMGKPIKRGNPY